MLLSFFSAHLMTPFDQAASIDGRVYSLCGHTLRCIVYCVAGFVVPGEHLTLLGVCCPDSVCGP